MANAAVSAVLQLVLLGALPFLGLWVYHRVRHKRTLREVATLAGLQPGERRYVAYAVLISLAVAVGLMIFTPPLEPMTREGSAQRQFVGLGLIGGLIPALLNGVVQTGFTEELLFRGLIAGSLSRHLPLLWANLTQAAIFLLPHLAILLVAPEVWPILPLVFASALLLGWMRIRSGSIAGPWIIHATANVTMALLVATRT